MAKKNGKERLFEGGNFMRKRNKDKDLTTKITEFACDIIILFTNIKKGIGSFFKSKTQLEHQTKCNVKGIIKAKSTPKSFTGCNFTYVKLEFLHEDPRDLFGLCLKRIDTEKDLSSIKLDQGIAYVRGLKYVGQLFDLGDTKSTRAFIENNGIIDDWVKLSILPDSNEWKEADKSLKIMF